MSKVKQWNAYLYSLYYNIVNIVKYKYQENNLTKLIFINFFLAVKTVVYVW